MPYSPTVYVNGTTPAINATDLNKLKNELASQAAARSISHSLSNWTNGIAPAVSDPVPLNEMERVIQAVATSLGLSYTPTVWGYGWSPARNATRLNRMETQAQANRSAIDALTPLFPASYYTGPLGNANLVPATTTGALFGTWCSVGGNTETQQRAFTQQRMTDTGRSFDMIQFQGTQLTVGAQDGFDWIDSLGIVPIHTWNTGTSVATINAGSSDAVIDAKANALKVKPYKIMIRLMHEFNLSNTPYYHNNNPTAWKQAWQRIVTRFDSAGATNCGFYWCPTEQGGNPERSTINSCYPGDAYVDWVGSDHYNYGPDAGYGATPLHPGWAEYDEMVNYDYYGYPTNLSMCSQWGPIKPFITGETGSKYDPANVNHKANWFRNIDSVAKAHAPYLRGIIFFDQWSPTEGHDWRVDNNQPDTSTSIGSADATTYQGYKDLSHAVRWNVGFA